MVTSAIIIRSKPVSCCTGEWAIAYQFGGARPKVAQKSPFYRCLAEACRSEESCADCSAHALQLRSYYVLQNFHFLACMNFVRFQVHYKPTVYQLLNSRLISVARILTIPVCHILKTVNNCCVRHQNMKLIIHQNGGGNYNSDNLKINSGVASLLEML